STLSPPRFTLFPSPTLFGSLLPEGAHLRLGRRDGPQLALLTQLIQQPVAQNRATLIVCEPTPPLLLGPEPRRPQLRLELRPGGELLAHVLDRLLDLVLDLPVRHLEVRVPLRLLHEQLVLHHLSENLPPQRRPPRRIGRELLAFGLHEGELLLHLRGRDGRGAHDGDDAVHDLAGRSALGADDAGQRTEQEQRHGAESRPQRHRPPPGLRAVSAGIGGGPGAGRRPGGGRRVESVVARIAWARSRARPIPPGSTDQGSSARRISPRNGGTA